VPEDEDEDDEEDEEDEEAETSAKPGDGAATTSPESKCVVCLDQPNDHLCIPCGKF